MARVTGRYERTAVAGEEVRAFVPRPLPPADPPLSLDSEALALLGRAERELGRLELAGEMVPSVDWFIYGFVRKEAVISSQIEGTQATLIDLLTFEAQREDDSATGTGRPGSVQLRRRARVRERTASPSKRAATLDATAQSNARAFDERCARCGQTAREGPAHPKLDRRHASGERRLRSTAAKLCSTGS